MPTWTQVTLDATATGSVTAFAYGGRLNGVDNPDVLYIGMNGKASVRTTAGGTANATATPFPGASVQDITLPIRTTGGTHSSRVRAGCGRRPTRGRTG